MTDVSEISGFTPGPWEIIGDAMQVRAHGAKGSMPIADIRGWGHLTGSGHGALSLPPERAVAIQRANAALVAAAPDMHAEIARLKTVAFQAQEMAKEMDAEITRLRREKEALAEAINRGAQVDLPDFLDWLADRLVNVYSESLNIDFVHSCRDRAKCLRAAIRSAAETNGT